MREHCDLCPRKCAVAREKGERGFCGGGRLPKVARAAPHYWEEPCISGEKGTGAVFFSGCNLGCVFCQNSAISRGQAGVEISVERLTEIFLELQNLGVHTLSLITATHYANACVQAMVAARERGLRLPVVWNSGGYDSLETVKMLENTVDVFMPDMKFWSENVSVRYTGRPDYGMAALDGITAMVEQAGEPVFDEKGILRRGVLVRHLALPGQTEDSKSVLDVLWRRLGNEILLSLMNQYTPLCTDSRFPELQAALSEQDYQILVRHALDLGFQNVYVQKGGTVGESFIPAFNLEGVL